jgi:hypothetical protein
VEGFEEYNSFCYRHFVSFSTEFELKFKGAKRARVLTVVVWRQEGVGAVAFLSGVDGFLQLGGGRGR